MAAHPDQLTIVPIRRRSYIGRVLMIPRTIRKHYLVARGYSMSKTNAVRLAVRLGWQLVHW